MLLSASPRCDASRITASDTDRPSYSEGAGFAVLSFGSLAILTVASSIATARIYGVVVVGEYALVAAAVLALRVLSMGRARPAVIREYSALPRRDPRVTSLWIAVCAFSATVAGVMALGLSALCAWLFNGPVGAPHLLGPTTLLLAGYVLVGNAGEQIDNVLTAKRAGRQLLGIRFHEWAAFFVTAVVLGVAVDDSVWGLAVAGVASWVSPLLHRLITVRAFMRFRIARQDMRAGFAALPEIIRFGLKIMPAGVADGISNQISTWILGAVGSVAQVGAWGRAWMMTSQIQMLGLRINEMLLPTLVERRAAQDGVGFDRAFIDSIRYAVVLLLLPAAAVGGAAVGVMDVFGPGFAAAGTALAILLAMLAFSVSANLQVTVLYALDRPTTVSLIAGLRLATTVIAAYFMARWLGPTGAALAMLCGYVVDCVLKAVAIRPHLSGPVRRFWSVREGIGIVLAYVAGFAVAHASDAALDSIAGAFAASVAGAAAYLFVYLMVAGTNPRDRLRLMALRRRIAVPLR